MEITVRDSADKIEWDKLLGNNSKSVFRTIEWAKFTSPDSKYIIATDDDKLVGCMFFSEGRILFRRVLTANAAPAAINDEIRLEIINFFKKLPGMKIVNTTYQDEKFSDLFVEAGFKQTDKATVIVELEKYDDPWKFLHYDKRRRVKQAVNEGIKVVDVTHDESGWEEFFNMYQIAGKNWGVKLMDKEEFMALRGLGDMIRLFFTKSGDTAISGSIVLNSGDTSIFYINATIPELKAIHANVLLVWEIMKYSKENGFKHFDLFGYDPHAKENERSFGINNFKLGFGGEIKKFSKFTDSNMYVFARHLYNKVRFLKRLYFFFQRRA